MDQIIFTINGKPYTVNTSTISSDTSLNTFIRIYSGLKGTKYMCLEGGCGVCIVSLSGIHPVTKNKRVWAVNSCLWPIYSCHGLDITTIEGLGNRKDGYHPLQTKLTHMNGTQCGYCSPGMIMNMYSLLEQSNGKISMVDIENSFGGNMCRCTGYRPILDAFKTFANDASANLVCYDIEDLPKQCRYKAEKLCEEFCHLEANIPRKVIFDNGTEWHKVLNLNDVHDILNKIGEKPYMIVGGNTAHGVYRRERNIEVFIDVNDIEALRSHVLGNELILGANINLTEAMKIFTESAKTTGFEYCKSLASHIDLIANVPVRDAGTIAGNLSIKHAHNEFPSDMFLILETVGATLTIGEGGNKQASVTLADYLKVDMKKKVLYNIILPSLDPMKYQFRSYKIMPRAQNAHAYVNAGFLFQIVDGNVMSARICYGGITPNFIHSSKTEQILVGKNVYTNETLSLAIKTLESELEPDSVLPDASPEYRKNLAIALFYKFILNIAPNCQPEFKSGGEVLFRGLSCGEQHFDTYEDRYPLTKPVRKYEGLIQCSGEAQYVNDIPTQKDELWIAFVPATEVHAKIGKIDASNALKMPGVHSFLSAKDIPGENTFVASGLFGIIQNEELFVGDDSEIMFFGQPIGVILAESSTLANVAASMVKVTYMKDSNSDDVGFLSGMAKLFLAPLLQSEKRKRKLPTIKDTIKCGESERIFNVQHTTIAKYHGVRGTKEFAGNFEMGAQYHYTMEPQTCVCIPSEQGMDVYAATQWIDFLNIAIAKVLGVSENSLNFSVRRLGGGYGAKISRSSQVACACALACHITNRPIRFVMTIESNMTTVGKRYGCLSEYVGEIDDVGKIQKLTVNFAHDCGSSPNDPVGFFTQMFIHNCYIFDTWDVKSQSVITDSPSHTWCRAPGTTEGIAMIENIMEHIAFVSGQDRIGVRLCNMADDNKMKILLSNFLKDTDYRNREKTVNKFNEENRWKKRGIAVIPMEYPQEYFGSQPVFVTIHNGDGSVSISHGGIECGQGINTKAQQVTAYSLGIPLELVNVKPTDNFIGANAFPTGGSFTSEAVCFAITKACAELLARIKPIRDSLPKNSTWKDVVKECYNKLIDLTAKYAFKQTDVKTYITWGLSCAEIEVDILTGNIVLRRVDILEDTGESMSPNVDVGQVEGAFIMGVGYWLTENLVYDRQNGELLTNRTWTYKPPGPKDIPVDFRINFLHKSSNEAGVLRSKATGEPALCMSFVVILALRHALNSSRKDNGIMDWYELGAPSTPETTFLAAGNSSVNYKL